jgi:hypothetical protein
MQAPVRNERRQCEEDGRKSIICVERGVIFNTASASQRVQI